jgi:hypothetical protein
MVLNPVNYSGSMKLIKDFTYIAADCTNLIFYYHAKGKIFTDSFLHARNVSVQISTENT